MGITPDDLTPVSLHEDPRLAKADPGFMISVANDFSAAAHQLSSMNTTMVGAINQVSNDWVGQGSPAFKQAADPVAAQVLAAGEAMMGASSALSRLASALSQAQSMAASASSLATQTNTSIAQAQTSYAEYRQQALAGIPHGALDPETVAEITAPTAGQQMQATILSDNAWYAQDQMNNANSMAVAAFTQAQKDFDVVTAQSPSVEQAITNANIKEYYKIIDGLGLVAIVGAESGMVDGADSGGEDDEGDPVLADPAADDEDGVDAQGSTNDPIGAEADKVDFGADQKLDINGSTLDADIVNDDDAQFGDYDTTTGVAQAQELVDLGAPSAPIAPYGGKTPPGGYQFPPPDVPINHLNATQQWNPAQGIPVIGRLPDTEVVEDWDGHMRIEQTVGDDWTLTNNDEWVQSIINQRGEVYVGSNVDGNEWNAKRGEPSVFAREMQQLRQAGYLRIGDYLVPPPS